MFASNTRRHARMMTVVSLLVAFLFTLSATTPAFTQSTEEGELEEPVWTEYRDARFGYVLAVPGDWQIYPTSLNVDNGTLVMMNFGDEGRGIPIDQWPKGALKIDITVYGNIDKSLSLEDAIHKYLDDELTGIVSLQEEKINNHSGVVAFLSDKEDLTQKPHQVINLLLPPSHFMSISVLPEEGWEDSNIQAILNSLAFPGEDIIIPPFPPVVANVILPSPKIEGQTPDLHDARAPSYVAGDSLIELYMPFRATETWTVGGAGYFYGEGSHTTANNDYYATDWNDGVNDCGRNLYPVAEGTVLASGWDPDGYGNWIKLSYDLGTTTLYGHMRDATTLDNGTAVSINTILGYVGTTGSSSGCHLHLSFKVDGVSKENISPSRKPGPMWTTTGLWDLSDGANRIASKSGTIYQEFWRGGQGWRRTIPVENLVAQWGSASSWSQASWLGTLPGSGTVQAVNQYAIKNTVWQSVWRGDQGWTRTLSIVNGVPNWSGASAWSGPQSLSGLPGSGSIQALNAYAISETLYQSIWRGDQGWSRTVPIVNGVPNWSGASNWSGPQSLSGLPGTGSIQALNAYPIGNTKLIQSFWRNDQGWTRTVNIVNGQPDWNNAPAFSGPSSISGLPGSGSMLGLMALPVP